MTRKSTILVRIMGTAAAKRVRRTTTGKKKPREKYSRSAEALETSLSLIFDRIAQLLVINGFGFANLEKLAKISFVNAATAIDLGKGEKINKARIAALTGLTRTEVSFLLRREQFPSTIPMEPANRALRVAQGWLNDPHYIRPNNSPRRLAFKGGTLSFTHLVKRYSGDIPARAMLSEMKRLGMVRHDPNDYVILVRSKLGVPRRTMLAMRAISPWIEMLTAESNTQRMGGVTSQTKQIDVRFKSQPQLLAAIRELEHRRIAFLNSLEDLGAGTQVNQKHTLRISVAVAVEKAIQKTKRR